MNTSLVAGAVSGAVGLLVFLTIHHFMISPIWFILPVGLILAVGGGLAVGRAYQDIAPLLPSFPWNFLALSGLIVLLLLPSLILPHFREPMFEMTPGGTKMLVSTGRAVFIFVFELLLPTVLAGAAAGWWIGKTPQTAARLALAGLVFALGPGHNIPFISGARGAVIRSWVLLAAIILSSALTLILVDGWLRGRP